jgi:hypothetical protein
MSELWRKRKPEHRKCQFCKQEHDCTYLPDPFLAGFFDEIEMVWLCDGCFRLRREGKHLPDLDPDEVPEWL